MAKGWNRAAAVAAFRKHLIEVEEHNFGTHWKLRGHGVVVNCWPTTGQAFVFGKTFFPEPEKLAEAMAIGRIRPPPGCDTTTCRKCGDKIHWLDTDQGKRVAVSKTGELHRCYASEPFRRQVRESLDKIAPGYAPTEDHP